MDEATAGASARLEDLFARQATLTPEAPAIHHRGRVVSYGALAAEAEAVAVALARLGVGPGALVAVRASRTPSVIALLLGVLKAGGAWLALDAREPAERLRFMLADSGAVVLVVDADAEAPAGFGGAVLDLGPDGLSLRKRGLEAVASLPVEAAYVIYTSGSSGTPKGVVLGHGARGLVEWARGAYSADERGRVAGTTSLCFDPSIFEVFVPLCTGGAMVLKANALEPFGADERPTMLDVVPPVLAQLCRSGAIPDSVRVLNVGGELLSRELAEAAYRDRPWLGIWNHYGPSEATTVATVGLVARGAVGEPAIGRPVAGAEIVVLDTRGRAARDGQAGEIHIGGTGLALGYLNRPELTSARFVERDGRRLYRTGDLGAWRDGELHFGGRLDRQVKVRGYRVEPGEVEAALMRADGVSAAVVVARGEAAGARLIAYLEAPLSVTPALVRQEMATRLPKAMTPACIVVLERLPRLASGKVDHSSLPEPFKAAAADQVAPLAAEAPIVHAFAEVLQRARVGPDESFFDLGGDSLASEQVALRLEELFGFEVPSALLYQAETPRALAAALRHGRGRAERHLTLLQPGPDGTPLFCLADLFGTAFTYLTLAKRLGGREPVYGVVPGPLQDAFARDRDLARLVRSFVAEIRQVQPRGPYRVAGYSAGGLLAFQVATALEAEGECVRLILLDAFLHARTPTAEALARWTSVQARRVAGRPGAKRARRPAASLGEFVSRLAPGNLPDWLPRSQRRFALALMHAQAQCRSGRFGGPTLIVEAAKRNSMDAMFNHDGCLGWSAALHGEVTRASVASGHPELMRDPAVDETAQHVRDFLGAQARKDGEAGGLGTGDLEDLQRAAA